MIRPTMPALRLAQRLTLAIFCADFLTMLAMNCLRLRPITVPWIFFPLAVLLLLASKGCFDQEQSLFTRSEVRQFIAIALAFGGICAAVRWDYLTEPFRHQIATAVGDDLWHLQELNSLVNSPRYPAWSSFDPAKYLSFYYAPWVPAVALYSALPVRAVTLAPMLFAVNAVYDLLLPLALLGIALPKVQSRRQMRWAIYLVTVWSGVQSFYSVQQPFRDTSWVLRDVFGLNLQFSNLATLMIWVIHHFCSAMALLLAYALWQKGTGWRRVVFCALLLDFSAYSSAFVLLGSTPFVVLIAACSARKRWRPASVCLSLAGLLAVPLAWLYLRKPQGVAFELPLRHSSVLSFPRWLVFPKLEGHYPEFGGLLLFLVLLGAQFFFVPWFLVRSWREMKRSELVCCAFAAAYLLSTFFVGFTGANNYCMRGAVVPSIVLSWIGSRYLPSPSRSVQALMILGTLGTWQTLEYQVLRSVALHFNPPPYLVNSSEILAINQDRTRTSIDLMEVPGVMQYPAVLPYYVEKVPNQPWPVETLPDRELQTLGPSGLWGWQRR